MTRCPYTADLMWELLEAVYDAGDGISLQIDPMKYDDDDDDKDFPLNEVTLTRHHEESGSWFSGHETRYSLENGDDGFIVDVRRIEVCSQDDYDGDRWNPKTITWFAQHDGNGGSWETECELAMWYLTMCIRLQSRRTVLERYRILAP